MPDPLARCPICSGPTRRAGTKNGYRIRRCSLCAHTFVGDMPSPDELRDQYEYERGMDDVPEFVFPILRSVVAGFEQFRSTGRLLDVGFGAGALLRVAAESRWEAHGIDIARAAVTAARRAAVNAELVEGNFLAHPYPAGSFDVVVFDGIVANLHEPLSFFRRAREVLRPGGLLYVTTPHGRGISSRLLGPAWSACAPPEHLNLFSVRSVALAARQAGFSATTMYTRGMNPLELIRVLLRSAPATRGTAVNAALVRTGSGRLVKRIANAVLRMTQLGDQLYLEAIA